MRVLKKTFVTFMATAMAVTSVNYMADTKVDAAQTTALKVIYGNNQKIAVGSTLKLVMKVTPSSASKSFSYTSSSKKIASVSAKGVVKGIKPGKVTITVKAKDGSGKKATAKVTVAPAKVKSVTAAASGNNAIKVTWKKQSNVTGYQILVSTKKSSGYKVKKTVKGAAKSSTTLTGLAGGTYYVKVRAYKTMSGKKVTGENSVAASAKLWKLVWSDEFNGTSLNMNNWTYEIGNGDDGWGNQEAQYYTAGDNIKFENGSLVIIPRMVTDLSGRIQSVTSTRIISRGKKAFKYGKMEIRAKASLGEGTWSAGWMLGTNGKQWPHNGEIDIFEAMNAGVPQTIHCPYFNNQASAKGGNKTFSTGMTKKQCAETYHTYGIIWTDKDIQFTVDGKNMGKYEPYKYSLSKFPLSETWTCFQNPFYFILNCAVGGNAAGNVSTKDWTLKSTDGNTQTWEDYCYIDYVRVYQ